MLVRCRFAAVTLAVSLVTSAAIAQEGTSAGKLTLPDDLFGGEGATQRSSGAVQPMASSGDAPPVAYDSGGAVSYSAGGASYSQSLGAHLRARYNTQSYGQPDGNLDLGTMLMTTDGDTSWFFDGQVTLNDESHVGFNVGSGVRTLYYGDLLGERLLGLSIWADGTSTLNDNFFPQLGLSYELLGDKWDIRANASFVLSDQTQVGSTNRTGGIDFFNNNLVRQTITGQDDAMHLTEIEVARRVFNRELWGFAGGYGLYGELEDTSGFQAGMRGYATPDLGLQVKVTDDDLFGTNLVFSATWFIGRTRTNTPFTCDLRDRMREPVIRNDYVAIHNTRIAGGDALTNDFDGDGAAEDLRFVHVDSTAGDGGDGSFENPYNSLDDANGNTQTNDIILVHADSNIPTDTGIDLLDGQRLLGEGDDMIFQVPTTELGLIAIPETAPGARAGASPIVNLTAGATGVRLADGNEVANLNFVDGASGITGVGNTGGDPNLHDMTFTNQTGDAIVLTPLERVDGADTTIAFNATLENLTFTGVMGNDIDIDATTVADPTAANVTLNELITINNITSTNDGDFSLRLANTHAGGTTNISNYTYNGSANSAGGVDIFQTAGTVNVTDSSFTGGGPAAIGFNMTDTTGITAVGASVTVTDMAEAARMTNVGGTTDFAATVNNTNASGGTVTVTGNTGAVNVNGDITSLDATSVVVADAEAAVTVSSSITRNGAAGVAVDIDDNVAGDGGSVTFSNPNATITSNGGSLAFDIDGGDDEITVLASVVDTGGIRVDGRTDGLVDFAGGLTSTTANNDAVLLNNNAADSIISFMNLDITTNTGRGFVAENGTGEVNVTGSNTITTGNTTGALVLDGDPAQPVTSTSGITFDSIDTGAGSTNAVVLDNVEALVQVNGGVLNTTANAAAQINNADAVVLAGVEMNSGGATAVQATYTGPNINTLTISDADLNNDAVIVTNATGTADADTIVSLTDITDGGLFDFDTTGAAALTASMTRVTGNGATTLDVTGSGDGTLAMDNVNTGSAVVAFSSAGSSGDLAVTTSNSGNTDAFTSVTVTDNGDGDVTTNLTSTAVDGALDLNAAGDGDATFNVFGGSVTGAATVDANNTGVADVLVDGAGTYDSGLDITLVNQDDATATVTGADVTGDTTITGGNSGMFDVVVDGSTSVDGNLDISAANTNAKTVTVTGADVTGDLAVNNSGGGLSTTTIDGATTVGGAMDVTATNNGNATVTVTGAQVAGDTAINGANTGSFTATLNGSGDYDGALTVMASNTGAATVNMTGTSTVDGAVNIGATGGGVATINLTGNNTFNSTTDIATSNSNDAAVSLSGVYNDVLTVSATNSGDYDFTMVGADVNAGAAAVGFDLSMGPAVADASLVLTGNNVDAGVSLNAQNNGSLDTQINGDTVTTGSDDLAFVFTVGSQVDSGDILIQNSNYTTNNAGTFVFTNDANGLVDFQLDDNSFINGSAAQTAATITNNAGVFNATIGVTDAGFNGNLFTNGNNATDQLLITSNNASTVNLLLSGNIANGGSGNFHLTEAGASTFGVHDRDNTDAQNNGAVTFDPAIGSFDNLPNEPQRPTF